MSSFAVQIYKNANSSKPPVINLPIDLPQHELTNPALIRVAQSLFEPNGILLINNLFSKELIAQLHQVFVDRYTFYFEDKDYDDALNVGNKRTMITVDIAASFNNPEVYANPLLLYLMRELLGPGFVLGSFGAVISLPGSEHQHIHRDHPSLFDHEALDIQLPSFAITVVVPLVDLTPETGSTRVWKGSHKQYSQVELNFKDSFIPFVPMGSCYLMDYQLLHGGTPNISTIVRPILYLTYYRAWFQEVVNYEKQARLSITKQEYEKIPEKYQFLFDRLRESKGFGHPLQRTEPIDRNQIERNQIERNRDLPELHERTAREQVKYLETLAQLALNHYGLKQSQLKLIAHGDNTVFSVSELEASVEPGASPRRSYDSPYRSNQFILRVHRSNYLSTEAIESELRWLQRLRQEAQLTVPEPIPTVKGQLWILAQSSECPEARVCSLTRWVNGQSLLEQYHSGKLREIDLELVGRLIGTLHAYAEDWAQPEDFIRPCWNWEGLFGTGAGYSINGDHVWELTPSPYRSLFEELSAYVKTVMASLGEGRDQFGMIHGDLWLGNLLLFDNDIRPIDFADCGFGYWGYDLARFLSDFSHSQTFPFCLDKVLYGYNQVRVFPEQQLPHLATFIAAQQAALALWRINRAQDHPSFQATLDADLKEAGEAVAAFLKSI